MSVLIKHMAMPKGCIYANDKDQTDYCPMLNHDDAPFCQYIENEPEIAIGIDERPVYCPLSDVPDKNVGDIISRAAAIDALCDNCDNAQAVCSHYPCKQYSAIEALPSAQPNLQQTCNQFATDLQLPLDKAQLSTEKVQLSTEKTQLSEGDRVFDSISRQAAIDAIEGITSSMSICVNSDECHGMKRMQRQAVLEIANLPAIQPKLGTWLPGPEVGCWHLVNGDIVREYRFWYCSACGAQHTIKPVYNFCPNCGADMRGNRD